MANDEHVAMLGRGAAAWNAWRADCGETPDLSRAGLRGLDLSGLDLSGVGKRGEESPGMAGTSRKIVIIGGGIAAEQRPLAILVAASVT